MTISGGGGGRGVFGNFSVIFFGAFRWFKPFSNSIFYIKLSNAKYVYKFGLMS